MKLEPMCQAKFVDQGQDFVVASVPLHDKPSDHQPIKQRTVRTDVPSVSKPLLTMAPGKNYALLFATNKYYDADQLPELSNPESDAYALAKTLQDKYGFIVDVEAGLGKDDIYKKLGAEKKALGECDQLLVLFSGHGLYHPEESLGFIATRDSDPDSDDPDARGINYNTLRPILDNFKCKHILLALDVCFGGVCDPQLALIPHETAYAAGEPTSKWQVPITSSTLSGMFRLASDTDIDVSDTTYINRVIGRKSRLLLASRRKESVSDGEPGYHSPFAAALLDDIDEHAREHKMLIWQQLVADLKRLQQEPHSVSWDSDADPDFVFEPK